MISLFFPIYPYLGNDSDRIIDKLSNTSHDYKHNQMHLLGEMSAKQTKGFASPLKEKLSTKLTDEVLKIMRNSATPYHFLLENRFLFKLLKISPVRVIMIPAVRSGRRRNGGTMSAFIARLPLREAHVDENHVLADFDDISKL